MQGIIPIYQLKDFVCHLKRIRIDSYLTLYDYALDFKLLLKYIFSEMKGYNVFCI